MASDLVSTPDRSPEQPASAPASAATTFLDASSVFDGVIRSGEPLRLDGRVKGEIHCAHTVVIGESARIEATIRADVVAVAGEVRGEVHAARKITLAATARMVGELTTPAIAIEEGAELVGRAQIGTQPAKSAVQAEKKADDRSRDSRAAPPPAV
jgi:cytoskeletal protein CcmA (bactofilin family)